MEQGHVRLDGVETLVLDEADHMLDLGFLPDVKRILAAVPRRRQTLLFSATMPKQIEELAGRILHDPVKVYVTPAASTTELVDQRVQFVHRDAKPDALAHILAAADVRRVLVFTRTKRGCDRVVKRLNKDGIPAQAIHGNKSQNNREKSLNGFRAGKVRVLVATDIAARGIDVDDITHVINYEIPNVPETYVHRIGRTARAGAAGVALSLCAPEEREFLRDIERLIRRSIQVTGGRPGEPVRQPQTGGKPHGGARHPGQPGRGRQDERRERTRQPARQDGGRRQGGQPRRGGSHPGSGTPGRFPERGGHPGRRLELRPPETKSERKLVTFGVGV
jgi:ATP-dependent RNA helicase RhlE